MSLRDTIEGARREAQENVVGTPKKEAGREETDEESKRGFSRRSTAKARPVREAASSVRVASRPKSSGASALETKDQKKERRRKEREEEDLRNRAYDIIMRSLPGYKQTERVFWVFLGTGFALAVVSVVCSYVFDGQADLATTEGMISVVALVLAYVFIIGGFVYNLVKRRPFRKEAEARVRGMSTKKILELFEKERQAEMERRAKKAEKKSSKK